MDPGSEILQDVQYTRLTTMRDTLIVNAQKVAMDDDIKTDPDTVEQENMPPEMHKIGCGARNHRYQQVLFQAAA